MKDIADRIEAVWEIHKEYVMDFSYSLMGRDLDWANSVFNEVHTNFRRLVKKRPLLLDEPGWPKHFLNVHTRNTALNMLRSINIKQKAAL